MPGIQYEASRDNTSAFDRFGSTQWSVVLGAQSDQSPAGRIALEKLCQRYWKPLYFYARRLGRTETEAQDLTQAFFANFLEKGYIRAADPQRGRFRGFLRTAFRHFVENDWTRTNAKKRGGGVAFVAWEAFATDATLREPAAATAESPAEAFDRQWALRVFDQALERLRAEYLAHGRERHFERLKRYLSSPPNDGDYASTAAELGVNDRTIAVSVLRMRQRFGEIMRTEVAQTLADPADVEDELAYLARLVTR